MWNGGSNFLELCNQIAHGAYQEAIKGDSIRKLFSPDQNNMSILSLRN